ncbi:MAG TPA: MBL fold metallo-hydrolase [Iamia sp.]|jgi:L-ascorbate metabolism protein UlaG (beta-lactamase superfamily)|nr:MBL fold metallo-hydrolase [Iamia sp.]
MTRDLEVGTHARHDDPTTGRLTFVGTATVILELCGLRILTDPNFLHQGQHAPLGYGLRSRRLTDPAFELGEVLPVDLVVLSHHHGDHFDDVAAEGLPDATPIISTPHACRKLARQGFTSTWPLDRWETQPVRFPGGTLDVTAMPARHAPQPLQAMLPPVMGSLLDLRTAAGRHRTYISGDTLLHDDLDEIPQRYPEIDLGVFHGGGTRIAGVTLTMTGPQVVEAIGLIDPDHAVPVHRDDYTVFKSGTDDLVAALAHRPLRTEVHILDHGDSMTFPLRPA